MSSELNNKGNQNYIANNSKTNIPGYDKTVDSKLSTVTDAPYEGKQIRESPVDEKNANAKDNFSINKPTDKKVEECKNYEEYSIKEQNFDKNIKRSGEYKNIL